MWLIFDADGTGILDKDTCFKLITEIIGNLSLSPKENIEEIYEASFGNFDKNGNGTIERNDIILIFKELVIA
jgi:Ca2+-binding EF-hand superfamily protein